MNEIITPSQVAALLQLNVRTVYRLAQEGVIPGNKIGRGWRFKKSAILNLLSDNQRKSSNTGTPPIHREPTEKGKNLTRGE
ncbi:MAG: helix-turn-helix domain-containing protein [Candidatus Binatia bacterium]